FHVHTVFFLRYCTLRVLHSFPTRRSSDLFVLGLATQGAKIATDTIVQSTVEDAYRGRIFSVYDVLFNVAFVGAAGVAALMLPPDGRSVPLVVTIAVIYGSVAVTLARFERQ